MNYQEAINYMIDQLPMFHRIGKAAYKANLDNAQQLDSYFGCPHRNYKTIHIAGTNGKGSVSHTLAAILQKAGYKTGLFTSPHLKDFRERIRVNGTMVGENYVSEFITRHQSFFNELKPSFFEMTSAMAFEYFKQSEVDVAIIEVGLGGRLDSTNIITPVLSVITNIGFDHTEFLGDTLEKIASEKAGIIKPFIPVVIGEYNAETIPVFRKAAKEKNSELILAQDKYQSENSFYTPDHKQVFRIISQNQVKYTDLRLDLGGFYQQKNICTVLTAVDELNKIGFPISEANLREALLNVSQTTGLQGRWQILGSNPLIICDTGHNYDGLQWFTKQIEATSYKKLHIVLGFVSDKAIDKILPLLPKEAVYYFTQASIPRALDSGVLKELAQKEGLNGVSYTSVKEAFHSAKKAANKDDFIFIGGSTFVVAEVL
jgi:dihydrofolate synthase / folylpolyglutamate synthase